MSTNLMEASREWASRPSDQRFQTLTALRESVHNRRMRSAAFDEPLTNLNVIPQGENILIGNGRKMTPNHWSFGQFSGLVKAPASFLRTLKSETAATVLNECIDRAPREAMKIMTVRSDDGNVLQAVTSTKYGRIWDADVVDSVQRIVDRSEGKFHNPKAYNPAGGEPVPSGLYASDRDIFVFMIDGGSVFDAGPRAQLNRGFITWNSEVGNATFGLMTFLFNVCCGNHILWGAQDVNRLIVRHTSGGPARFDREAMPILLDYAKADPSLDAVKKAQTLRLQDLKPASELVKVGTPEWTRAFGKEYEFTTGEVNDAVETAKREEQKCDTLWDMVQGFTATARDYEWVDARVNLEKRAGNLLNVVNN